MDATDEIMRDVLNRVEDVLDEAMVDVADDLRKELSVPVDYSTKPPTRSKPGEFPRLDTKRLRGSVASTVYRVGRDVIVGAVVTRTPYDQWLVRTRPYDKMIESKWRRLVEQRLTIAFR